jgi:transcriptional regulator GlxA family with amidase domain
VELAGTFLVRSSLGDALLAPNAILLGRAGDAYELRHVDDGGDRSLVFEFEDAFLDDIPGGRFRRVVIPSTAAATTAAVLAHIAVRDGEPEAILEAALAIAGVARDTGTRASNTTSASTRQHAGRVARALRYAEAHSADDCSLATLAREAKLTRYHFLRMFAALTGQTPHQYVIATRLRKAAIALRATRKPITEIAFAAGFGDLSNFTRSFTRAFAVSPRAYRR